MKNIARTITALGALGITLLSHAENSQTYLLTVKPLNPKNWGYMGTIISIDKKEPNYFIREIGKTIPVSIGNKIYLTTYAMNIAPALDSSCLNLQITGEKDYFLTFELHQDWKVYCTFY